MAEGDLVGGVGDGLVGGGARAADRDCLYALGQHRQQGNFACDVRRENGRDDRSEDEGFDFPPIEVGALNQLGDAYLAEIDGGDGLECSPRSSEGGPHARDDRHAAAIAKSCHGGKLLNSASR